MLISQLRRHKRHLKRVLPLQSKLIIAYMDLEYASAGLSRVEARSLAAVTSTPALTKRSRRRRVLATILGVNPLTQHGCPSNLRQVQSSELLRSREREPAS